jgi:hypothetical protein
LFPLNAQSVLSLRQIYHMYLLFYNIYRSWTFTTNQYSIKPFCISLFLYMLIATPGLYWQYTACLLQTLAKFLNFTSLFQIVVRQNGTYHLCTERVWFLNYPVNFVFWLECTLYVTWGIFIAILDNFIAICIHMWNYDKYTFILAYRKQ